MIKSYTDLEQSKKLAEILPLKSADMYWSFGNIKFMDNDYDSNVVQHIPVWSLAALLDVLPEYNLQRTDWTNKTEYKIAVTIDDENFASKNYDNPVDACVAMIERLHELKML